MPERFKEPLENIIPDVDPWFKRDKDSRGSLDGMMIEVGYRLEDIHGGHPKSYLSGALEYAFFDAISTNSSLKVGWAIQSGHYLVVPLNDDEKRYLLDRAIEADILSVRGTLSRMICDNLYLGRAYSDGGKKEILDQIKHYESMQARLRDLNI